MVYYGCSTWPNRGRWLLIVAFSALGAALTVLHAFETAQCVRCETTVDGVEVCEDYKQGRDADWTGPPRCPARPPSCSSDRDAHSPRGGGVSAHRSALSV